MVLIKFLGQLMSFDQALICRGKGGIYAAPWLAATSGTQALSKYYKNNDIECINVGKTCDALHLALKSDVFSVQQTLGTVDNENCMVKEGSIPFRVCTNIWFGTLKIYQQQVNNLYKQSEDLVACSRCYDIPEISLKRKGQSCHNKSYKKRRLTITDTSNMDLLNENYTELLDDFEKWTQQMPDNQSEEVCLSNVGPTQLARPRGYLQIREITIREISATSYGISELDDDGGFGEATSDEITQFFTFSDGREHNNFSKRSPSKRKSNYEDEPLHKLSRFSHDTTEENERCERTQLACDCLSTPIHFQRTCELAYTPTNPCDATISHENETFGTKNSSSTVSVNKIKEELYESDYEVATVVPHVLEDIEKKEIANDLSNINKTKKLSKLIIDLYIKIEQEDMLQQINAPTKLLTGNTRDIIRKFKYKKRTPATELLKRLNKRTEKFCQSLKQKNILNTCQSQFEQDYMQLLRDILKTDYKDEWAAEVYPKWNNTYKAPMKRVKNNTAYNTGETLKGACKSPTNLNFLYENTDIVVNDENNNPKANIKKLFSIMPLHANEILMNSEISNEWRPYGVMMKLLGIWRYSTEAEINAVDFCFSATVVTDTALAFSSLLSLSKDQFIEITKIPETINMDKIILGNTVKNLIKVEN